MAIKTLQPLQATLDDLAGFLVNIKIDMRDNADLMPIFEILFPVTWQVLEHRDFTCEVIPLGQNATSYKFSQANQELSADAIVEHIKRLIAYNEEIEKKQSQLIDLQKLRESELQSEIEKLRTDFLLVSMPDTPIIPKVNEEIGLSAYPPSSIVNRRKNKLEKQGGLVSSYTPEREADESDIDAVETPE